MAHTDEIGQARRRAAAKYGFIVHTAVYVTVMVLLVIINLVKAPGNIWFIWPLLGWGFAVGIHGIKVFWPTDRNGIIDALTKRELRQSGVVRSNEGLPRKSPK